jgi:HEAT repeat protein
VKGFLIVLAVFAGVTACDDSATVPPAPRDRAPTHHAIAELSARIQQDDAPPEVDGELVDELVRFLVGADLRTRELPLEDVARVGDGALPILTSIAVDPERSSDERIAAIELIEAVGTRAAGLTLIDLSASTNERWIRSHAAWRLSELDPSIDIVIPGLLLRMRSETDHEAAVYIAAALAERDNFAGLEMLTRLASVDADQGVRARAADQLATIVSNAGAPDAATLIAQWNGLEPGLAQREPSDHLRLAVWQWIQTLSGDTFQLRPVDDGRFLLTRLGPWAVDLLARALGDTDPYTRLHSAQCLERMGAVARPAIPALTTALDDPRLAPQAALSLGAIGGPGVLERLLAALESGSHEVRVAAARALGALGDPQATELLRQHFADVSEPIDLRQAAAESALRLDPEQREAARFLSDCLIEPAADVGGAEHALDLWIKAGDAARVDAETFEAWKAAEQSAGAIATPAESQARRAVRFEALQRYWLNAPQ